MSYSRKEFKERAHRLYAPIKAMGGCVKVAIQKLHEDLVAHRGRYSFHRARELWLGRARPTVEDIDFIREKDGAWCPEEKKAKPDLMQSILDEVKAIKASLAEKGRAQKSVITRMYQDNRA